MIKPNEIFVFGSNLAGRHGKGAALDAVKHHGAIRGQGVGLQGRSYAIPTKDHSLSVLPLRYIEGRVREFIAFARNNADLQFYITPVGCGLAGYSHDEIKPMFAGIPDNCRFAETWEERSER